MARLWLDVEDLFEYRRHNSRPSGIQRVEYELCRSLALLPETRDRVRFVRHDAIRGSFYVIGFEALEALYIELITSDGDAAKPGPGEFREASSDGRAGWRRSARLIVKRAVYRLPHGVRTPLLLFLFHQRASLIAIGGLFRAVCYGAWRRVSVAGRRSTMADAAGHSPVNGESSLTSGVPRGDFERETRPGDLLVSLGSPWFHPSYAAVVKAAQQKRGLGFALLIHDILPLRRPEWFERGLTSVFGDCIRSVLPLVDVVLTISHATAADVVRYAAETGVSLRAPPMVIPMGSGFTKPPDRPAKAAVSREGGRDLPPPGSYALIVSTIEARKNHALLFRVWRQLLDDLPAAEVPTLVFAGRVGWLVADLMQQLANANYLNGKIVLVRDPTDSELVTLYRGCRFTLFPSFYEGWGLPVTESMGFGRPCIISNTTSLPEAGGALARYFDPANGAEAYRVIRNTITDAEGLRAWQEKVAREFVPVTWEASVRVMCQGLDTDGSVARMLPGQAVRAPETSIGTAQAGDALGRVGG